MSAQNPCSCNIDANLVNCLSSTFNQLNVSCVGSNSTSVSYVSNLIASGCLLPEASAKLTPQYLIVKGKLIIDGNYTFSTHSEILMTQNSNIEILGNNGYQLTIGGAAIYGCQSMWEGIKVPSGAAIQISSCTISDSKVGIVLSSGSKSGFTNNYFHNNYISISTPDLQCDLNTVGVYPSNYLASGIAALDQSLGGIKGNTFEGSNSLLSPFNGSKPLAGIFVEKVGLLNVGNNSSQNQINNFENLQNGIVGCLTNLDISNSKFKDIGSKTSWLQGLSNKVGVLAYGLETANSYLIPALNFKGLGETNPQATFDNCEFGISTYISSSNINNTLFKNVGYAAYLGGIGVNKSIKDNSVNHYEADGFDVDVLSTLTFDISKNSLTKSTDSNNLNPWSIGINIQDNSFSPTAFNSTRKITKNIITNNNTQIPNYGLLVSYGNGFKISDNNIVNHSGSQRFLGIGCYNVNLSEISDNEISSDYKLNIHPDNAGMKFSNSNHNKISCNTTHGNSEGIKFTLNDDGSQILQNTMLGHDNYLKFDNPNTITGVQKGTKNQWPDLNQGSSSKKEAYWPNVTSPQNSQFQVNTNSQNENPNPIIGPLSWFTPYNGTDIGWQCFETNDEPGEEPNLGLLYGRITAANLALLNNSLYSPYYNTAYRWEVAYQLFDKLGRYPDLMSSNSVAQSFYTNNQNNTIGKLNAASNSISELTHFDQVASNNLLSNYQNSETLKLEIIALENEIEQATDPAIKATKSNMLTIALNQLNISIHDGMQITNDLAPANLVKLNNLVSLTNTIITTNIVESNLKTVIELVTSSLQNGTYPKFTNVQNNALESIASTCAYEGGRGVYWARALLKKPINYYNDDLLCMPQPILASNEDVQSINGVAIYPNPVEHELYIQSDKYSFVAYQIYTLNGLLKQTGNIDTNRISVKDLPVGMFILRLTDLQGNIKSTKFIHQ